MDGECIVSPLARYRIYSETLPYDDVTRAATLSLLRRYGLELVLAVRPWQVGELAARVAPKLRDEGLAWSVWPMIADDEGRWANVHNAGRFADFVRRVCDVVEVKDVLL